MIKKLIKNLSSMAFCATLVIGATAIIGYAAESVESTCSHSYYIVDWTNYEYRYVNSEYHDVIGMEGRYCMDCGRYWEEYVCFTEDHYFVSGVCKYCGETE